MSSVENNIWLNIRKLVVVVNVESPKHISEYRKALKSVGLNVHECKIIGVIKDKKVPFVASDMGSVVLLAENDFGLLGQLKNEDVKSLLADSFDAILVIGDQSTRIEKVFRKIKCKINICLNSKHNFAISLVTQEVTPEYRMKFVKQIVERLK